MLAKGLVTVPYEHPRYVSTCSGTRAHPALCLTFCSPAAAGFRRAPHPNAHTHPTRTHARTHRRMRAHARTHQALHAAALVFAAIGACATAVASTSTAAACAPERPRSRTTVWCICLLACLVACLFVCLWSRRRAVRFGLADGAAATIRRPCCSARSGWRCFDGTCSRRKTSSPTGWRGRQ